MRPLIGLNTSLSDMNDPLKAKALCHLKYIDAIAGAGGVPIVIPPYIERSMLEDVLPKLDGFCLIGGPDYDPIRYGGHPQQPDEIMDARRNVFDLWLAAYLLENSSKPVLGICGGHQLINISLGGALIQDLRTEWKSADKQACTLQHSDDERTGGTQAGNVYRHEVRVAPGSRMAAIVGGNTVLTNSYHHQAIDPARIGAGLKVTAWAPDGVIEAVEAGNNARFLLGIQWHPERQADEREHRAIFESLVAAAGGR